MELGRYNPKSQQTKLPRQQARHLLRLHKQQQIVKKASKKYSNKPGRVGKAFLPTKYIEKGGQKNIAHPTLNRHSPHQLRPPKHRTPLKHFQRRQGVFMLAIFGDQQVRAQYAIAIATYGLADRYSVSGCIFPLSCFRLRLVRDAYINYTLDIARSTYGIPSCLPPLYFSQNHNYDHKFFTVSIANSRSLFLFIRVDLDGMFDSGCSRIGQYLGTPGTRRRSRLTERRFV